MHKGAKTRKTTYDVKDKQKISRLQHDLTKKVYAKCGFLIFLFC